MTNHVRNNHWNKTYSINSEKYSHLLSMMTHAAFLMSFYRIQRFGPIIFIFLLERYFVELAHFDHFVFITWPTTRSGLSQRWLPILLQVPQVWIVMPYDIQSPRINCRVDLQCGWLWVLSPVDSHHWLLLAASWDGQTTNWGRIDGTSSSRCLSRVVSS